MTNNFDPAGDFWRVREATRLAPSANSSAMSSRVATHSSSHSSGTLTKSPVFDYERIIFQALVNEGKHEKVLNTVRAPIQYSEKDLREAAHAEVAQASLQAEENYKALKKKKKLNADEKAQQSRDRNREHAKNTRLRKKAYVGKLKELVDETNRQNEAEETHRKMLGEKIYRQQTIRKNAAKALLYYHAANVRDRSKWASLLHEDFTLTMPITPFRSFRKSDIRNSCRVTVGIDAAMADAASVALMVESIGQSSPTWKDAVKKGRSCRLVYSIDDADNIAAGDLVMLRYQSRMDGFEQVGGLCACLQTGMLMCRFDAENKIISAEIIFDVMGYMQQLQRASCISPEYSIIPNTLEMAMQLSREAQAVAKAYPPYNVLYVNEAWTNLNGHTQGSAQGVALTKVLRMFEFQTEALCRLATECAMGSPASTKLMVLDWQRKNGAASAVGASGAAGVGADQQQDAQLPLIYYVKLLPLTSDSDMSMGAISHMLVVLIDLPLTPSEVQAIVQQRGPLPPQPIPAPSSSSSLPSSVSCGPGGSTGGSTGASASQGLSARSYSEQQQQQQQSVHPQAHMMGGSSMGLRQQSADSASISTSASASSGVGVASSAAFSMQYAPLEQQQHSHSHSQYLSLDYPHQCNLQQQQQQIQQQQQPQYQYQQQHQPQEQQQFPMMPYAPLQQQQQQQQQQGPPPYMRGQQAQSHSQQFVFQPPTSIPSHHRSYQPSSSSLSSTAGPDPSYSQQLLRQQYGPAEPQSLTLGSYDAPSALASFGQFPRLQQLAPLQQQQQRQQGLDQQQQPQHMQMHEDPYYYNQGFSRMSSISSGTATHPGSNGSSNGSSNSSIGGSYSNISSNGGSGSHIDKNDFSTGRDGRFGREMGNMAGNVDRGFGGRSANSGDASMGGNSGTSSLTQSSHSRSNSSSSSPAVAVSHVSSTSSGSRKRKM